MGLGIGIGLANLAGGVAAFSPLSLAPTAWFRADKGIVTSAGSVQSWADQSGNGHNLAIGAAAANTFNASGSANGQPCINFGATVGLSTGLQNTSFSVASVPADIFVVCTPSLIDPSGTNPALVDMGNLNNWLTLQNGSAFTGLYDGATLTGPALTANAPCVLEACNLGSASSFMALNGGSPVTGSAGSTAQGATKLTIGNYNGLASDNWVGDIYEVIICGAQVTSTQRAALLGYASARYGIVT